MAVSCGSIDVINTVLCFVILVLGIMGYVKRRYRLSLAIGAAFGLFGISHIITILGLGGCSAGFLVAIRVIAYLIVALTLYRVLIKR
jgi:uncharacterized membrane protein (UPF0136 family)